MRGRQGNAVSAYQEAMTKLDPPVNVATGSVPLYDGAPTGADYTAPRLDIDTTIQNNPGLTRKKFGAAINLITSSDGVGHANNIKAAQEAHANINPGCLG